MNELALNEWVCEECSLINKKFKASCVACGCKKKSWFCIQCASKNSSDEDHCIVCCAYKHVNSSPAFAYHLAANKLRNSMNRVSGPPTPRAPFNNVQCSENNADTWVCEDCLQTNSALTNTCGRCRLLGFSDSTTPSRHLIPGENSSMVIQSANSMNHRSQLLSDVRLLEEKEAAKLWHNIRVSCKILKSLFVDETFPPTARSVFGNRGPSANIGRFYEWLRPHEMRLDCNANLCWKLFNNPHPSDIIQGTSGNCWLMSALSVIAERESLLERIFITSEYNSDGAYQIRLCKDGKRVTVLVDDLFPCNEKHQPIFSQAKRKQLWVPLIEKAVAKLYGSYQALDGGFPLEGLALLTGQPCESIILDKSLLNRGKILDTDMIWAELLSSREMQFLLSAGSGVDNLIEAEYKRVGLRRNHAYSILDVQMCKGNRLLKLHDPQGRTKWKGDWSVGSPRWTKKLRSNFKPDKLPSGTFWMSFEDMLRYFQTVDVCRIRDSWNEVRLHCMPASPHSDDASCFILNVFETTEMEFSLFEESRRGTGSWNKTYIGQDFSFGILIFNLLNASIEQIGSLVAYEMVDTCSVANLRTMLQCGRYVVVGFFVDRTLIGKEDCAPGHNCVLALYSSKQILLEQIPAPPFFSADILINMSISSLPRTHYSKSTQNVHVNFYELREWNCFTLVVENNNERSSYLLKCVMWSDDVILSTRGKLNTSDCVPPKHRKLISFYTLARETGTVHFKYEMVSDQERKHISFAAKKHLSSVGKTHIEKLHVPRPIF